MIFTADAAFTAGADYATLGNVAPYFGGGFSHTEITDNAGGWGAYAAGKYGSLPAGSRVYLDLESSLSAEATSASLTTLINDTKTSLPQCMIGTYHLQYTDAGAFSGGRTATVQTVNNTYATTIAAADWLGPDWYQVAAGVSQPDRDFNMNECNRVRAGKPTAPFVTHAHATGGGMTTLAEHISIFQTLRSGGITELTLWANIPDAPTGSSFVRQLPIVGQAIRAVWCGSRSRGRGR